MDFIFSRFKLVSAFSATSGGILDKAIEAEDRKHGDFMRLVNLPSFGFFLPEYF